MRTNDTTGDGLIRVGLLGFGKAGQAVCSELAKAGDVALEWVLRRHASTGMPDVESVIGGATREQRTPLFSSDEVRVGELIRDHPVDFLVDFSCAASCHDYVDAAALTGTGIVSAISNYEPHDIERLRLASRYAPVLHSPNITVGINFVMLAARILRRLAPHADIEIVEEHFRQKPEVSGTARRIANALGLDEATHVNSVRVGGIVGRHEVIFGFPYQTLRLVHDSISRHAFGQGALFALRHLSGRGPGFYTMEELVGEGFVSALAAGDDGRPA